MRCGLILFTTALRLLSTEGQMSADFVKIYPGFFKGSLIDTPPYARLLFLAMLSEADHIGVALGTVRYWSALVGISEDEVRQGLAILNSPDPDSTSPDEDGRRIVPYGEGSNRWRIVNYWKYYEKSRNEDRKEQKRDWDRTNRPSGHSRAKSGSKKDSPTQSVQSDPENESENESENEIDISRPRKKSPFERPTLEECQFYFAQKGSTIEEGERFFLFYESVGWKVGKKPMEVWKAAASGWISRNKKNQPADVLSGDELEEARRRLQS